MALALNVFQTVTKVAPTSPVGIYTAPVGYTGVVLLAHLPIEASDSANLVSGRLVLETNDVLKLSANTATDIKFIGSILETLN